jgi:hypothetical protein
MRRIPRSALLLGLCLAFCQGLAMTAVAAEPLRFFAIGDLPYRQAEVEPLGRLLASAISEQPPFIVHVGDIKAGSAPCTDANLHEIAALFREQPVPVVYTPGDNEWTDCHREAAGGLDPLVRLDRVRQVFFRDPQVLRLAQLGATQQGPTYPENFYFLRAGVLLVALHVVGSNNGYDRERPASVAEFEAREAANRALLKRALGIAEGQGARALVILVQANPLFERGRGPRGFRGFKDDLIALMGRFPGPVLLLHGDTHRFQHDRPLIDPTTGSPFERLVRVEVPGSPTVGGVWITVDLEAPEPFAADPVYAVSLDSLGDGRD